jgi:integrase
VHRVRQRDIFPHRTRLGKELPDLVQGQRYPITESAFASNKARKWKAAGVDARIHDLRHTTGMRTLRKTGTLKVAQKLLGHTDIAIVAKFYIDVTVEDLRAAMESISAQNVDRKQKRARPVRRRGPSRTKR